MSFKSGKSIFIRRRCFRFIRAFYRNTIQEMKNTDGLQWAEQRARVILWHFFFLVYHCGLWLKKITLSIRLIIKQKQILGTTKNVVRNIKYFWSSTQLTVAVQLDRYFDQWYAIFVVVDIITGHLTGFYDDFWLV